MRPLMIFDGDCGFCTASVNVIKRWIKPDCDIEPWQFTAIEQFNLVPEECSTAVQYVDAERRVHSGSRAVMRMLRDAPLPWPVIGAIGDAPGIAWIADRTYKWIAINRYKLPGSTPACEATARAA